MARLLKTNPNKINLEELGKFMAKLDLQSIPPEKRRAALMDHFLAIQEYSLEDREIASQINMARKLLNNRTNH